MRILQLYNNYQSGGGGEAQVVRLIEHVLRDKGNIVRTLTKDSKQIHGVTSKLQLIATGAYSPSARREIRDEVHRWSPDVVHVHNLYPLFSPSVLAACGDCDVPVVMTVHNYGLTCPVATHFRDGKPCTLCFGGREYHCIAHNCKRSLSKSTAYAFRSYVARVGAQFVNGVTLFMAISEFVRDQMIEAGYAADQVIVLENAVPLPTDCAALTGDSVTFVGRMEVEKGVDALLAAAAQLQECRFVFVGDGRERVRWAATASSNCSFVGSRTGKALETIYRQSRLIVVPSVWWEPFGLVVAEAMSYGKPVIASRSGALPELVEDGVTGLLFPPADVPSLVNAIRSLWSDQARVAAMGREARRVATNRFAPSQFGDKLVKCYEEARNRSEYKRLRLRGQ